MTRTEQLLVIAAEECNEVAQRLTKALRFGLDEKQEGQPLTNADRILQELNDLFAVLGMLQKDGALPTMELLSDTMMRAKQERVEKWLRYSQHQGTLDAPAESEECIGEGANHS